MRLLLATVSAFALASASGVVHANIPPPPSAGDATLSPDPVEPDGRVTVSSIDPCRAGPQGEPGWLIYSVLDAEGSPISPLEGLPADAVFSISAEDLESSELIVFDLSNPAIVPNDDGSWMATFDGPASEGSYAFEAECVQVMEIETLVIAPNPCEDPEFADDPANEGLCEPDDEGLPDPCDDLDFVLENPELCGRERHTALIPTTTYRLQFDVVAAAEPPPPVREQPTFTG